MRRSLYKLRRRAESRILEGFFNISARIGKMHPDADPAKHGVEVIPDLAYRSSLQGAHRLDVYRPVKRRGPAPCVLYIHGGAFQILSKETHWIMGLAFARQGYVVFNVSYRLAPQHPFPAAVHDVADAFLWVTENGASYGADLDRLVIAGESAGANLATSLTLATVYERDEPHARAVFATGVVPRAAAPACGIFQVSDTKRFGPDYGASRFVVDQLRDLERAYLGRDPKAHGAMLDFADVLPWLERGERPARPLPPFFIPVGTWDPLMPETERLDDALTRLGGTVEARYYEGGIHAFHAFVFAKQARRCWRDQFRFLERHVSR